MLLEINNLDSGYGFLQVLWNVSMKIDQGEFVCVVGPNGAGKTTTLKTIAGLIAPMKGEIVFKGKPIGGLQGYLVSRQGISYIPEDLNLFAGMTVKENLILGAFTTVDKKLKFKQLHYVYELFPRLKEREKQFAGTLSGGERKMLAIGRGLMSSPLLLMVDEPSLGLAPHLIEDVFNALDYLKMKGMTIFLVEQNVKKSFETAERGYILEKGRIMIEGDSSFLASNDHVQKAYLGL